MKQIRDTYKKTGRLHHAYGILGEREKVQAELFDFLKKDLKFPVTGNPDFWTREFNVFKIADSRTLHEAHMSKPVKYERKVFVLQANFMTKDAQNSLLKIFEEPRADAIFFLNLPKNIDLLPTLKSRLFLGDVESCQDLDMAEEFLKAKVGRRLAIIDKILKNIKEEKATKSEAINFVKSLEKKLHQTSSVEDLEKALSYLNDESPSVRVILEHLAITV